jgi:hypothetical protein
MKQFGIEDKVKALEIGQRLYDAGYIAAFEAKDRTQGVNEAQIYFWNEVVVMERTYDGRSHADVLTSFPQCYRK